MSAGRLVVLEGAEGVGKTTQLRRLESWLRETGIPFDSFREPGGTALGTEVRRLLLDSHGEIAARAEALLFMASRAELVEREIRPALAQGHLVLLDRFFLSTYAYQVGGRGLREAEVVAANALATGGLVPDLTLILELDPRTGLARAGVRAAHDRIERSGDDFHTRVARAFASYLTAGWQALHPECGPIARIDAAGDEEVVFRRVMDVLANRWPETFAVSRGSNS